MKATQGKAEFTMEFAKYSKVPDGIAKELMAKYLSGEELSFEEIQRAIRKATVTGKIDELLPGPAPK